MEKHRGRITYFSIVRYSTIFERILIILGATAAIGGGVVAPIMYTYIGSFVNDIIRNVQGLQNSTLSIEERDEHSRNLHETSVGFISRICVLGFVLLLCSFVENETFNYVTIKQIYRIRRLYYKKILDQDISWYDTVKSNPISSDITENMTRLEDGMGEKVPTFLGYSGMFVVCIIIALISGYQLALVCLISLPACTIAVGLSSWIMTKFVKDELDAYSTAGSIAEEVLSAMKTVVAFEGQTKEREMYTKAIKVAHENNRKRALFSSAGQAVVWLLIFSCYGLSFWYGFVLIDRDTSSRIRDGYTLGRLMTVFFNSMGASMAFASASPLVETFKLSTEAARKIFDILDQTPTINLSKTKGIKIENLKGHISFRNVTFHYPSRPDVKILDNFNLHIRPGQTIALVGNSGCGKSTIVQLLHRLYDPTNGEVLLDGINIKELNLSWLRSIIGTVWQEPVLFDATIKENILLGNPNASQDDIELAAKKADVHDFIAALPKGYDTLVSGTKISGGQKQRIAIARAFVRNPTILVFDEATSALDAESEIAVRNAFEEASKVCTTIIIAHRLSTVRHADMIVVMNAGKIVEQGTHLELLSLRGQYYNLAEHLDRSALDSEDASSNTDGTREEDNTIQENNANPAETSANLEEKSLFRRIMKLNEPEKFHIFVGTAAAFLNSASLPIYSVLFGDIIQAFTLNDTEHVKAVVEQYCIFFLLLGAFCGVTTFLQTYMLDIAGERLTMRLRMSLFKAFMEKEIAWFDESENNVGSLCAILAGESASIQAASGVCIGTILNSSGTFLLCLALAFFFHWKLAVVCFSIPAASLAVLLCEQFLSQKSNSNIQKSVEKSTKLVLEAVSNIRTVASLGCETTFLHLYQRQLDGAYDGAIKATVLHSFSNSCFKAMPVFTYGVCIYYGVHLILQENLKYGEIFKVSESVLLASMTIANTLAFVPNITKAARAAKRIFQLTANSSKHINVSELKTNFWAQGNIFFSKVHFSYPERPTVPVLRGLDLRVLQGKTVALVGANGCGKSTVIQLLERYYDPCAGCIFVDKHNIKTVDVNALRWQLGVVSQEPNLFNRTIAENIAYGDNRRNVGIDEIIDAAEAANIHLFVASLPLGYDTRIGEKGAQLSIGQKQRIAIARAIIRKPKVLLLDEATSALDSESAKVVQEALHKAKKGRTCVVITHKITTTQDADLICVIHEGKVAEMGRHASLLNQRGLYFHYCSLEN